MSVTLSPLNGEKAGVRGEKAYEVTKFLCRYTSRFSDVGQTWEHLRAQRA